MKRGDAKKICAVGSMIFTKSFQKEGVKNEI